MIRLRELRIEDAPLMLEWMHDKDIQEKFQKRMIDMTIDDAKEFCKNSKIPETISDADNIHFAIVSEDDEYLGTVSLKDINLINMTAEFAISTRKKAHGKGIGKLATGLILKKAFAEYGLHKVYLNVLEDNAAALGLYRRCGFVHEGSDRKRLYINGTFKTLEWYGMLAEEFDENKFGEIEN